MTSPLPKLTIGGVSIEPGERQVIDPGALGACLLNRLTVANTQQPSRPNDSICPMGNNLF